MIISASYKTDIPAFYGQWFVNRLEAGYCFMRNPMNRKVIRVPMTAAQVDGVVFWTKNFRPFMKFLHHMKSAEMPFIVQYTINGYPRSLEHHVVDWKKSVETAQELAERFGPRCVVWRYDTIILSTETPPAFHIENFCRIADELYGVVDEVIISFLQLYRKTERNLLSMNKESGNAWWDPHLDEKRQIAANLFELAHQRKIKLTICSQPEIITTQLPSRCIDATRLADVRGQAFSYKTLGNRPGCECAASRDIGDYDTCPHGCVYCYAVRSHEVAVRRFQTHDPESEFLFSDVGDSLSEAIQKPGQFRLFE